MTDPRSGLTWRDLRTMTLCEALDVHIALDVRDELERLGREPE